MILIYGKGKVGNGVASLCNFLQLEYEIRDDADVVDFSRYEIIVPSPGVPSHHDVYATGKVKSELDFAFEFLPKSTHIIAITGTDGKSTTSWILYELLRQEFRDNRVYLSGNFDVPFSLTVEEILRRNQRHGYIVLEVSSFMAYSLESFQPEYSIFTNFKSDHLNWHKDLGDYFRAKMNLIEKTKKLALVNQQVLDFSMAHGFTLNLPLNTRVFGESLTINDGGNVGKNSTDGEHIIISGRRKYKLSDTNFSGLHNALNILSATMVTSAMGICPKRIRQYLSKILGLPHRLEKIGEKNGIIFVEDSKSTSSQSLEAALSSYGEKDEKNLLLIVGGSDKGDVFDGIQEKLGKRVRHLVCIGATKDAFITLAKNEHISYLATDSLSDGVNWLYERGESGDVLMLSPGCASFGLFRDYLDRAEQFRTAVKKLH